MLEYVSSNCCHITIDLALSLSTVRWAYKTKISVCVKMWLKSTYSKLSVSRWGTSSLHVDMYLSRVINIILAVDSQTSVLLKCYMAYYWQQTVHVLLWLTHLLLSALLWLDFLLPRLRTKFSERSFSHASPSAWNDLPEDLHAVADSAKFRQQLKTYFFTRAFNVQWLVTFRS